MKNLKSFILLFLLLIYLDVNGQHYIQDLNWQTVFQDNFSTFNTSRWYIANNYDHGGEPEEYTNRSTNVYLNSTGLVLQANQENYNNHNYTSGWINSQTNYSYGYFEITCQMPGSAGSWPAFWLWMGNGNCGTQTAWYNEIDVFEMYGPNITTITDNIHVICGYDFYHTQKCSNWSNAYHVYAAEWSPSFIKWYVDGLMIRNTANTMGITNSMQLVANLALNQSSLSNNSTFPMDYNIKSINVYNLKMDCNTNTTINNNSDLNNFTYGVKSSITVNPTSSSSPISLNSGTSMTLRAVNGITINGDFNVPANTELIVINDPSCY